MASILSFFSPDEGDAFLLFWAKQTQISVVIIALFYLLSILLTRLMNRLGRRIGAPAGHDLNERILERTSRPVSFLVNCAGLYFAIKRLPLPERLGAAAAVARRAGHAAGRIGADLDAAQRIDAGDRAAAGADLDQFDDGDANGETAALHEAIGTRDLELARALQFGVAAQGFLIRKFQAQHQHPLLPKPGRGPQLDGRSQICQGHQIPLPAGFFHRQHRILGPYFQNEITVFIGEGHRRQVLAADPHQPIRVDPHPRKALGAVGDPAPHLGAQQRKRQR